MGLNIITLGSGKNYTNQVALGIGNMRVEGTTVYFTINETGEEVSVTVPTPADGISIENIVLNSDNTITCEMSDGTEKTTDPLVIETTNIAYTTSKDVTVKNVKNALDKAMNIGVNNLEYTTTKDASITNVKGALDKAMDINVDTLEYENNVDATINNVKGALDKLMVKTDSELEAPLTPNVQMGTLKSSYPKGTPLEEIIRDMLTEKIAPKVTLSISPSKTLYDIVTESISSLTINATVTKQTYDVAKIEYFINDVEVKENTSCASGGSFPYIHNTEIKETSTIKVVVTDKEGLSSTITKKIEFYPVIYYGIVDAETGEPTEAMIKTLSSKLQNTKVFTYEGITTDWGKVCVAVPKMLGNITTILDPVNALSYTNSFSSVTVKINGYDYAVYIQIDPSAASGITLKFS